MQNDSNEIRASFYESDSKRDMGLKTPVQILRYDDIKYAKGSIFEATVEYERNVSPGQSCAQLLDVYRPTNTDGPLPVIVSVHGGAWVYGDKSIYQYYCMELAKNGFAVVNFSYRLAPDYEYPASLIDTGLVFKWVSENAIQYGFDLNHLYAVGDSAGAHLLMQYCILNESKSYQEKIAYNGYLGIYPKAVALNCGVYDFDALTGDVSDIMYDLMPPKWNHDYSYVQVLPYMTSKFPRTYIMTCVGDFLRNQPTPLMKRLDELGVVYHFKEYGSEENPLSHVFHCNIRLEEAMCCNDEECAFFLDDF